MTTLRHRDHPGAAGRAGIPNPPLLTLYLTRLLQAPGPPSGLQGSRTLSGGQVHRGSAFGHVSLGSWCLWSWCHWCPVSRGPGLGQLWGPLPPPLSSREPCSPISRPLSSDFCTLTWLPTPALSPSKSPFPEGCPFSSERTEGPGSPAGSSFRDLDKQLTLSEPHFLICLFKGHMFYP